MSADTSGWGVYEFRDGVYELLSSLGNNLAVYESREHALRVSRQYRGLKVFQVTIIREGK